MKLIHFAFSISLNLLLQVFLPAQPWSLVQDHFEGVHQLKDQAIRKLETTRIRFDQNPFKKLPDMPWMNRVFLQVQWSGSGSVFSYGLMIRATQGVSVGFMAGLQHLGPRVDMDFRRTSLRLGCKLSTVEIPGKPSSVFSSELLRRQQIFGPLWLFLTGGFDWSSIRSLEGSGLRTEWKSSAGLEWRPGIPFPKGRIVRGSGAWGRRRQGFLKRGSPVQWP